MTIEGEILSIPEWTHIWLDPNERFICQPVSRQIIERALFLLGENKMHEIQDGENTISILQAHGSMGFEKTKVIIDVVKENKRLAAYMFLDDGTGQIMVINRPNNLIAVKNNGQVTIFNPTRSKTIDKENYEVGEVELKLLLDKIS